MDKDISSATLDLVLETETGCSPSQAQRAVNKYLQAISRQLRKYSGLTDRDGFYYVSQHELQNQIGRLIVKGQKFWVYSLLQASPARVLEVVVAGNNFTQKLTKVKLMYRIDGLLDAHTAQEVALQSYLPYQAEVDNNEYDAVDIDQTSLTAYLTAALDNLRQAYQSPSRKHPRYIETLERNAIAAHEILSIAQITNGQLYQIRRPSAFGRLYYRGPNLQSVSKIVRHAALGDCYEYDIESSVFAWKVSWFREITREGTGQVICVPCTQDYLDHKAAHRCRLAEVVYGNSAEPAVKKIKAVLTAVGFGAPLRQRGHYDANNEYQQPALQTILGNQDRWNLLNGDAWFREFMEEQQTMNTVIYEFCKLAGQDAIWRTIPALTDSAGRLQQRSVISYLYQHSERELMSAVISAVQQQPDQEILLQVHDCIYTRRRIDLLEIRQLIRLHGEYYHISEQHHSAYHWSDHGEIQDHQDLIAAQEQYFREQARAQGQEFSLDRPKITARAQKDSGPESELGNHRCYGPRSQETE